MKKDKTIVELLGWLHEQLGDLAVIDHWDADLFAVGISAPHDPKRLAYISSYGHPPGYYHVELEATPKSDSDMPYEVVNRFDSVNRDQLLKIITEHIGRK